MKLNILILLLISIIFNGCSKWKSSLPEVKLVEQQEFNLWKTEAHLYLPEEFNQYKEKIKKAKDNLREVESKIFFLRDYTAVQKEFHEILKQGEELSKALDIELEKRSLLILQRIARIEDRINQIKSFSSNINEGLRLRKDITKAEIVLNEGRDLHGKGKYINSEEKLNVVEKYLDGIERGLNSVLSRFKDVNQIEKWRRWAKEAINDSKKGESILVIKIDKKLIFYKNSKPMKVYSIGLGIRGLSDKYQAKDHATPEGRYRIIAKNPKSKYYKALLINYPNEEDVREFKKAKRTGLIPKTASIGGLIEIHGGGSNSITYGCISLDNKDMEELFNLVEVGTPVTIVGAIN